MTKNEAFVNWGTLNGHSKEKGNQFLEAQKVHTEDKKDNPEAHEMSGSEPVRCWHSASCSCGFSYDYDSSG